MARSTLARLDKFLGKDHDAGDLAHTLCCNLHGKDLVPTYHRSHARWVASRKATDERIDNGRKSEKIAQTPYTTAWHESEEKVRKIIQEKGLDVRKEVTYPDGSKRIVAGRTIFDVAPPNPVNADEVKKEN